MKIRVWQRGNVVSPATIRQRVSWGLVETNWRAPNSRTISVGNACKERKGGKKTQSGSITQVNGLETVRQKLPSRHCC